MHKAGVQRGRNRAKSLTNKQKRVNGDIIVRAGVINPANCTALRALERVHGILQSAPRGRINGEWFH